MTYKTAKFNNQNMTLWFATINFCISADKRKKSAFTYKFILAEIIADSSFFFDAEKHSFIFQISFIKSFSKIINSRLKVRSNSS